MGKKMEVSRLGPSHDSFTASKLVAVITRNKVLAKFLVVLVTVLISALVLNSVLLGESTRLFRLPDALRIRRVDPARPDSDSAPTNISHIFFGIGASVATWRDRRRYAEKWWDRKTTRGNAWFDEELNGPGELGPVPRRVSARAWARLKYSSSQPAVRIARIVQESFDLRAPRVRWFVMGDDDTVFFTENLVSVLSGYDHRQMYYIGGNSESVEQDSIHAYDMAFGGGGFAISYPLAYRLSKALDGCLDRYHYFYGSDQKVWACIHEIGAVLTPHHGFHQLDIKGDPYGLLSAHPLTPLVSLHHLDYLDPIFPNKTRLESLETLMTAYRVDPRRIVQQSFCQFKKLKLSVSVSWGYTVQIYPRALTAFDLKKPMQTFKTWRSSSDGPFTFNTRPAGHDPCQRPVVFFLDRVEAVGENESVTHYEMFEGKDGKICINEEYQNAIKVARVEVSSMKMDHDYWNNAPVRQCSEIMDNEGVDEHRTMHIRIRECKPLETVTIDW